MSLNSKKRKQSRNTESITTKPPATVSSWSTFGFDTCKFCRISKKYKNKKLRRALVQTIGPDTWKNSKLIQEAGSNLRQQPRLKAFNTRLKVQIISLAAGVHSKKWGKKGKKLNIHPKYLVLSKSFRKDK